MHNIPDFLRLPSEMQEHFAKGGMIKRADGSYSRRGLWDNIRANRGSGRKPTKEMLEQEAKIRAQEQYGGKVDEYGNGGYTVRRSNARKGKTHVVIGPDGTKKYFGDSKLGQHPNDPARKKAFYARHKHNLEHNPYFRAFARATWADGGEVPESDIFNNWKKQNNFNPGQWWQDQIMKDPSRNISTGPEIGPVLSNYDDPFHSWNIPSRGSVESMTPPTFSDGGSYGPFYNRRDAAKMQRMFTPSADSMTPYFDMGGLNKYQQTKGFVDDPEGTNYMPETANSGQGINTTTPAASPATATTSQTGQPVGVLAPDNKITPFFDQDIETSSIIDDKANLASGLKQNSTSFNNNPFIQGSIQDAQNITNNLNSNDNTITTTDNGAPGPVKHTMVTPAETTEPVSSGEQIAKNNQEYEDRMISQYGIKRSDIDKRYEELRKQFPNSTNEDVYSTINKEFADKAKTDEVDRARKAEQGRMKSIAGTLHGIDKMGQATMAGLDLFSRMNPNSYQNAVLNKNRENANPTNTMNIVGNRKGIEYSAYGGYTGLKEGVELNLSTQQIHELEKQGYKFQIL